MAEPLLPAVALLSGGLDSAVAAAWVRAEGVAVHTLAFDYGQSHRVELAAAERVSQALGAASHREIAVDLGAIGGSSITGDEAIPKDREDDAIGHGIPNTYVPARNTVFLALGLGLAEVVGADSIVIGANAVDYSGYPDCRGPYLRAFEQLANLATAAGALGRTSFRVRAPLLELSKAEIVTKGVELGVPLELTHSCYDPVGDLACGGCDSCRLRRRGFEAAGVPDPTRYVQEPA
jgi:7-cyano-7-deazaguanine synthase